jgi:hypothetical protein
LSTKLSVACLALIAVLLAGGNLLVDRSDPEPSEGAATIADGVVSSESSTLLVVNLAAEVDALRMRQAAAVTRAATERRAAKLAEKAARRKEAAGFRDLPGEVSEETLESIAECESGGDPRIVSSNGLYHGKYQFHPDTWESVGGEGLPSRAPEAEQDYRAALLYERSGPGQWPVCGS